MNPKVLYVVETLRNALRRHRGSWHVDEVRDGPKGISFDVTFYEGDRPITVTVTTGNLRR